MSLSVQGVANPYVPATAGSNSLQSANGPFANLDLSSDQQTEVASILQSGRAQGLSFSQVQSQVQAVLSPNQQATFQTDLQNVKHSGHRHHHGGGGGSSATTDVLSPASTGDGLTAEDLQSQILAANAINQS